MKAMKVAEENLKTNHGGPFGACIIKDGEVVATSSNHVLKNNDPTAHAEIETIREACKKLNTYDLSGCELYTTCYPCPMCLSAILWANIKKVYYGNTKEDAASIGFRDDVIYTYIQKSQDSSILELIALDREQPIKTFQSFSEKQDKTIY